MKEDNQDHSPTISESQKIKDPVCGMNIEIQSAKARSDYKETKYYFCSLNCKTKFDQNPGTYLIPEKSHSAMDIEYTCPMHPEIRQLGPGNCPKCGMTLEPVRPTENVNENEELKDFTRKLWIGTILTIPVFLISMGGRHFLTSIFTHSQMSWTEFILSTPVVLWCGWPLIKKGYESVINKSLNMFSLISLGICTAYFYSAIAVLFPNIFPSSFRQMNGEVSVYFEAAAVITILVILGQVLELKARTMAGSAIKSLLGLAAKTARIIKDDNSEEDVSIESVKVGDILKVRPGEKIPVDGIVISGSTNVDESMISGEPVPISKAKEDKVIAATINGTGSITIRAEKVGSETLLAQIINMVAEAQRTKAPIQKLADKVAGYFVPIIIGIAILTFILWSALGPTPVFAYAIINSVAVLIIACPCALGLATPMSIMVATTKAATSGVLFKDADAIENLRKINILVVDKTGTLTEGKPKVVSILSNKNDDEVLKIACSLESNSEHPLATAIITEAKTRNINSVSIADFNSITGKGVIGNLNGKKVGIGNQKLVEEFQIKTNEFQEKSDELRDQGETAMFVLEDQTVIGVIGVADPIKESSVEAILELKKLGIKIVMLTGDNKRTAAIVGKKLNIDEIIAEVLPTDKANKIKEIQAKGNFVAMAGDGINDAPALMQAQVGIAMGTGTDVAIHSAGITLLKGDLKGIVTAYKISNATIKNIKQNLFFAFIYNLLGVPVAAGVLYPIWGILLNPMIAAGAMSLSSVSVILNSIRLKKIKLTLLKQLHLFL